MSEEKPWADSELASAATAIESSDAAPEAMSVPRQTVGPAAESDGTADPVEAAEPTEPVAPAQLVAPKQIMEPAEPVTVPVFTAAEPTPAVDPAPETTKPVATAPAATAVALASAGSLAPPIAAPAPSREKRKRGLLTGAVFGLIVVVLLAAIGFLLYQRLYADPTKNAVVGNCLADLPVVAVGEDKEVTRVRVVDCGDAAATHIVEGRLDSKTEAEAKSAEVCKAYPDSTFIYRAVPQGGTGYVLCLKELAN